MNRKLNVGLVGWNGMMNIGDDVMTSVIVRHFKELLGTNFTVGLFSPNNKLAAYTQNDIEVKGLKYFRFFNKPLLRRLAYNYLFPRTFVHNKDIILFGGGSIFHQKGTSITHSKIIKTAKKNNKNVIIGAIGVSVGPFDTKKEFYLAKGNLEQMDFIVVRDNRSLKVLKTMDIEVAFEKGIDLAFLFPTYHNLIIKKSLKSNNILGLSLRANYVTEDLYVKYGTVVNEWLSQDKQNIIRYFNFSEFRGQNDGLCLQKLLSYVNEDYKKRIEVVGYNLKPLIFYEKIMECGLMICMRLHAAILSYSVGTTLFIESYHQKCIDLADELKLCKKNIVNDKSAQQIIDLIKEQCCFNNKDFNDDFFIEDAKKHFYHVDRMIKNL